MTDLTDIYHPQVPDFIRDIAQTAPMQRLRRVGMNCGCEYTSFHRFLNIGAYSRYSHSVGVGLIVWHFTSDVRQSVAALLHDISTPAFAHVIDFLHGDHMKQESTEKTTLGTIASAPDLVAILDGLGLKPEDVSDYHLFPIADNDTPRLSADRLEYTLGNIVNYGFATAGTARELYDDIVVGTNGEGAPELMFRHEETAVRFANFSLRCSKVYVSDEDRYAMQMLAELLKRQIGRGVISEADLSLTEDAVIAKLLGEREAAAEWRTFRSCSVMMTGPRPAGESSPYPPRIIFAKKRHIDPCTLGSGRVTEFDERYGKDLSDFLNHSFNYWIRAI